MKGFSSRLFPPYLISWFPHHFHIISDLGFHYLNDCHLFTRLIVPAHVEFGQAIVSCFRIQFYLCFILDIDKGGENWERIRVMFRLRPLFIAFLFSLFISFHFFVVYHVDEYWVGHMPFDYCEHIWLGTFRFTLTGQNIPIWWLFLLVVFGSAP